VVLDSSDLGTSVTVLFPCERRTLPVPS
jgi:hypothetical protein